MKTHSQSGNVFFLILAAVAMFAALSWAFTQGSRQSSGALTSEQTRMAAQEIIGFAETMATTVQKLKLQGCSNNQYNFTNSLWYRYDNVTLIHPTGQNPTASSNCIVFGPPGNAAPLTASDGFFDKTYSFVPASTKPGAWNVTRGSVPGVGGTNNDDLVLRLPFLNKATCMTINDMLGITNPSSTPPRMGGTVGSIYVGTLGTSPSNVPYTDTDGVITGKTEFCVKANVGGGDFFEYNKVLIAY